LPFKNREQPLGLHRREGIHEDELIVVPDPPNRLHSVAADEREKARADLRRAQSQFERKQEEARALRLDSFRRARDAGLSLREIASEVGLHYTRVGEILRDG